MKNPGKMAGISARRKTARATRRVLMVLLLVFVFGGREASASIFFHDCPGLASCVNQDEGGTLLSSAITYDDVTQDMTWTSVVGPAGSGPAAGGLPNLFWIAVTNGPEPDLVSPGSMVILIGDGDTGRVTAYRYWDQDQEDGNASDDDQREFSWRDNPNNFIESFASALTLTPQGPNLVVEMELNVANVNAVFGSPPAWTGFAFDELIGYWAAYIIDGSVTFDGDGRIVDLLRDNDKRTSWDRFDQSTQVVPGPPTAAMVALGAGLLGCRRRRRREEKILD